MTSDSESRETVGNDFREETASRLVIVRFRDSLRRSLGLERWQAAISEAAARLDIPAQRQGIGLSRALVTLPLEQQRTLLISQLDKMLSGLDGRAGRELALAWHVKLPELAFRECDWNQLRQQVRLRLASRYTHYKRAQNLLFQRHQRLVHQSAQVLCRVPSKWEDCVQEGYLGLLQAIDRAKLDGPLGAYACYWVRRRIRNYLMRNSLPVSAPANAVSQASRELDAEGAKQNDWEHTQRDLALAIRALQTNSPETDAQSIEASLPELWAENRECPINHAMRQEVAEIVHSVLKDLTEKQAEVLRHRFGLSDHPPLETLHGIARRIGISRQQVAEREKRALARLTHLLKPFEGELA